MGGIALTVAIYADRPHLREQLREDALVAGYRVSRCLGLEALIEGDLRPLAEVVLVDCPRPDGAALAALSRLDMRVAQAGAQLIVSTTPAGLEDVFACLDQSNPQLLVDAGMTDLALSLGRAMALAPGRSVREMADEDRMQLMRLTEQVGRLAARLGEGGPDYGRLGEAGPGEARPGNGRVESPAIAFRGAAAEAGLRLVTPANTEFPDPQVVRRILRQRQQRQRFFDADLFADPAWDMLLDLAAARAERKQVSVTSLCIAAGVPPTTALRWIGQLQQAGLFQRVEDKADRRRAFIALTDKAAEGMARYFAAVGLTGNRTAAQSLPV
ncbi:winged helix DNA-binding protein [Novosphingobium flavum]|uniref:Winged helix DNA-binding protein n=2 Tax=Novosphingobium flavum TaxID=1778672 RepID=A0A7X1FRK3_9SPHN|nr:winged helix DNA-binding protein [Novosphingobium flavum]